MQESKSLHVSTPLIFSEELSRRCERRVWLKMETEQLGGSFKGRGLSRLMAKQKEEGCNRWVSSSGGNAGLAAACAGEKLGGEVTVVVPQTTPDFMKERIASVGKTQVIVHGSQWVEADQKAREIVTAEGAGYVHPFEGEDIWEGHSSMVEEIARDMVSPPAAIVASVGGGGLLIGVARGLTKVGWEKSTMLVSVETVGTAKLYRSVEKGEIVTLPKIDSIAKSLGAASCSPTAFALRHTHKLHCKCVTDAQALQGALALQESLQARSTSENTPQRLIEPACGAALSVVLNAEILDDVCPRGSVVVVIACGGSVINADLQKKYKEDLL